MPPENRENQLLQVLRKIPLFKGLDPPKIKKILGLCMHKVYQPEQLICRSGAPSDEMYILLSGELAVVTSEAVKLASIKPVTTVGEMGVITAQPRSATVQAIQPSNLFVLNKQQLDAALRDDQAMQGQIYLNIVQILSDKLDGDNARLRNYQLDKERVERRMQQLDRYIEAQAQRAQLALDLALRQEGLEQGELELYVEEQLQGLVPRVLIADDEAGFRNIVKKALPAFQIFEAENGKLALEVVHAERLDLVITDIKMPVMDGFALQASLRSQFPDLPVLAVSGYADAEEVEKHHFAAFVDKPVNLQQFQLLVEHLISQKQQQASS
ncbi:MAG: response regulator [Candidatus Latescibacteria bacterium]|nr:response regulator [Candidatus Latescibacterota bacterium]